MSKFTRNAADIWCDFPKLDWEMYTSNAPIECLEAESKYYSAQNKGVHVNSSKILWFLQVIFICLINNVNASASEISSKKLILKKWIGICNVSIELPGTPVGVSYEISVFLENYTLRGKVHAEGFQTDETYFASAINDGNDLILKFHSYANGKLQNKYGIQTPKVGSELLRIHPKHGKTNKIDFSAEFSPDLKKHSDSCKFNSK